MLFITQTYIATPFYGPYVCGILKLIITKIYLIFINSLKYYMRFLGKYYFSLLHSTNSKKLIIKYLKK